MMKTIITFSLLIEIPRLIARRLSRKHSSTGTLFDGEFLDLVVLFANFFAASAFGTQTPFSTSRLGAIQHLLIQFQPPSLSRPWRTFLLWITPNLLPVPICISMHHVNVRCEMNEFSLK